MHTHVFCILVIVQLVAGYIWKLITIFLWRTREILEIGSLEKLTQTFQLCKISGLAMVS